MKKTWAKSKMSVLTNSGILAHGVPAGNQPDNAHVTGRANRMYTSTDRQAMNHHTWVALFKSKGRSFISTLSDVCTYDTKSRY